MDATLASIDMRNVLGAFGLVLVILSAALHFYAYTKFRSYNRDEFTQKRVTIIGILVVGAVMTLVLGTYLLALPFSHNLDDGRISASRFGGNMSIAPCTRVRDDLPLVDVRWAVHDVPSPASRGRLQQNRAHRLRYEFAGPTRPADYYETDCWLRVSLLVDEANLSVSGGPFVSRYSFATGTSGTFIVNPKTPGRHPLVLRLDVGSTVAAQDWYREYDLVLGVDPQPVPVLGKVWRAVNAFFSAPVVSFFGAAGLGAVAAWFASRFRSRGRYAHQTEQHSFPTTPQVDRPVVVVTDAQSLRSAIANMVKADRTNQRLGIYSFGLPQPLYGGVIDYAAGLGCRVFPFCTEGSSAQAAEVLWSYLDAAARKGEFDIIVVLEIDDALDKLTESEGALDRLVARRDPSVGIVFFGGQRFLQLWYGPR